MSPQQFMDYLIAMKAQVTAMSTTLDIVILQHHKNLQRPVEDPNASCQHPKDHRLPTPAMGHPNRSLCGVCGNEVDS